MFKILLKNNLEHICFLIFQVINQIILVQAKWSNLSQENVIKVRNHQRILSKVSNETIVRYIASIKQANLSDRDRIRSRLIHRQCTMITPRVILMTNQGKLRGVPRSKVIRFELIRPFIPRHGVY